MPEITGRGRDEYVYGLCFEKYAGASSSFLAL